MAVLAALYGAKPLPELLSELSQEQQLQAAMLADMWQLPAISAQAAAALAQTLSAQGQLSDAATKQLFSLTAVPDCLQQLLKKVLLSVLGNLEQCWANETLLDMLFSLPLSSMEVLLACSELKVRPCCMPPPTAFLHQAVGVQLTGCMMHSTAVFAPLTTLHSCFVLRNSVLSGPRSAEGPSVHAAFHC